MGLTDAKPEKSSVVREKTTLKRSVEDLGIPVPSPEEERQRNIFIVVFVGIIVFTVWWTNGSPAKNGWGMAIRYEFESAYVPGAGRAGDLIDAYQGGSNDGPCKKGIELVDTNDNL